MSRGGALLALLAVRAVAQGPPAGAEWPAYAVATKMGHLVILDRTSGVPLFPVEERPVPAGLDAGGVPRPYRGTALRGRAARHRHRAH